jgi:hypothetical protein
MPLSALDPRATAGDISAIVNSIDNIHVLFYKDIKLLCRRRVLNSSHIAAGTITSLLATVLIYLSHLPLQPLDLPTASAFAGLLVAGVGGLVKLYQMMKAARTATILSDSSGAPT